MLPPDEESDRYLTTKDLNLVGHRRGKFVFCYVGRKSPNDFNILDPDNFALSVVCLNLPYTSGRREAKNTIKLMNLIEKFDLPLAHGYEAIADFDVS